MTTSQEVTRSNGKTKPSKQSEPVSWRTLLRMASKPGIAPATATKLRAQAAAQRPKRNTTTKPKRAFSDKLGQKTTAGKAEFTDFINEPSTEVEKKPQAKTKRMLFRMGEALPYGDKLAINAWDKAEVVELKKEAQRLEGELFQSGGKSRAPQLEADLETQKRIAKTLEDELARRDQQLVDEFIAGVTLGPKGATEPFIMVATSHINAVLKALTRK